MRQTLALLLDAYRELNAKRMFWIALVISALVVLAFAAIGQDARSHLTLVGMRTPWMLPFSLEEIYKFVYSNVGVGLWLSFGAMILAIISTAGIFPDFMSGGSIDLYLSKPIGRLRLFLTKYATGLLFVALQTTMFSLACFLIFGFRGGFWEPRLFLAIPLVVCFFSYLHGFSVLMGVLTRCSVAAVTLTFIFWLILTGIDRAEVLLLGIDTSARQELSAIELQYKVLSGQANAAADRVAAATGSDLKAVQENYDYIRQQQQRSGTERDEAKAGLDKLDLGHSLVYHLKTYLPKTRETDDLLSRTLMTAEEEAQVHPQRQNRRYRTDGNAPWWTKPAVVSEVQQTLRDRSVAWVIGTSLVFEAVLVGLAAWVFQRRDF